MENSLENVDVINTQEDGMMPQWMVDKLDQLTTKEKEYLAIMWPKYGVLNITSKPGVAKSAIGLSIANKLGMRYIDIRLSMVDETDVGLYPAVSEIVVDGKSVKCLDFVVPRWAIEANRQPTIIHFEELNRASQQVRNAALQILLERCIGMDFNFNDNVLMMSSGNLGDEDGTDVEEFDAALNNRLIHIDHVLGVDEWLENFAIDKCHSLIVGYIKAHPEQIYKTSENSKGYATPRSWTMLSHFITRNFGKTASPRDFLPLLKKVSHGYVGNSAMKFVQYCEDMLNISIQDVINNYDGIKKDLEKYNRDKNSELIQSLKEIDISTLNEKQLVNITKFLDRVGDDEKTAYLLWILDNVADIGNKKMKGFLLHFEELLRTIKKVNKPGQAK
jgi:hypothetical protein